MRIDTRRAERDIGTFATKMHARLDRAIRSLPDVKLGIDANTDVVSRKILRVKRELESLHDQRIGVDIDAATAQRRIDSLSRELTRLGAQHPNVAVRADTAAASAALGVVSRQANSLDRKDVSIGVSVQGITRTIGMLGLLTAGVSAVGFAAPAAAAALAAIPAAAGAAAQGIGALAVGFSGVGDAVKALSDAETEAAAGTSASADQRVAAADRIVDAQRNLARAQQAADRASIAGAQRVQDARRALGEAERDAARAAEQAADDVVAARERLVDAGTAVVRAEADLHEARQQAIRDLQDLSEQVSDNALTIEGAEISLLRAQERQKEVNADAAASALDRREAALRVAQAQERLSDSHREAQRDQVALTEAQRLGVEASDRVLDAKFRLNDAEQAHREALAGVQDALLAQTRTQQESARKIADARRDVARAEQQAALAQQQAAQQVEDAHRQLARAMRKSGDVGASSMDKIAEAMANLGPEAEAFARFIVTKMLPALHSIRGAVQATLLPRLQQSMQNLMPLIPIVSDGLAETGRVIGDLAVKGSEMMASGPWQRDFATIMAGNNRILEDFGLAGLGVADAFRHITVAALPMVERFSQFTQRVAEQFAAWIEGKRQSQELAGFFQQMGDRLAQLGEILGQVAVGVANLSQALGPLGGVILELIGDTVEMIGEFAKAHPTITQFAAAGAIVYSSFIGIGKLLAGIGAASTLATTGFKKAGGAIAALMPAALSKSLTTRFAAVALGAGTLTEKFTRSANAGQRVANTGDRVASKMGKVAGKLPAVGLAIGAVALTWDHFNTSVSEAGTALAQGGAAAVETVEKLRQQTKVVESHAMGWDWLAKQLYKIKPGADQVKAGLQGVAAAQYEVAEAQLDFGLNSPQHQAALRALAAAVKEEELAQRAAAAGTSLHTQRIKEQQGQVLSTLDTEVAYRDSLAALGQSLKNNGTSFDINTAAGRRNLGALSRVIESSGTFRQALIDQGASEAEATRKAEQHRLQLIDTLTQMGLTRGEAKRLVDQYMKIPKKVNTKVTVGTGAAQRTLNRFITDNEGRTIGVRLDFRGQQGFRMGNGPVGFASGGPISGPGSATSDSVMARLSDGEHVWTAAEVAGAGGHRRVERLRDMAEAGQLPAFAQGGAVRVRMGSVPDATWQQLLGMGFTGDPTDRMEALYIPPDVLRSVQAYQAQLANLGGTARTVVTTGLRPLVESVLTSGATIQGTWARNTASILNAQLQQSGLFALLAQQLGASTAGMRAHIGLLQASSNASWANMRAVTSAEVGTMTGPLFNLLSAGLQFTQNRTAQTQFASNASWTNMRAVTGTEIGTITGQHFNLLSAGLQFAQTRTTDTQTASNRSWANIRAVTGAEVGTVTGPIFGGLHQGLAGVRGAVQHTADFWGGQLNRLRAAAANPIRWIMNFPLGPPGIAASWNTLDRQFKLGKHINPPRPSFATGGQIRGPGSGISDDVPIMASDGEFVVREAIASRTAHFLKALNAGQPEAIQAAGGTGARMPGFAAGGLIAAQQWAEANDGRPYRWGGVGPGGWDCSGWVGSIVNVARGQNPHHRVGTTSTFPWAGFRPGLRGALAAGAFKGNPGHMAATVGGINAEAGGRHNTNAFGPPAIGADHPQFRTHGWLPQVGGKFVSGGGGGGFDPGPIVNAAFAEAYRLVGDVTRFFGNSPFVTGSQGIARQAVDAVKAKAMAKVAATMGGLGPLGSGAPFYVGEISRAAKVRGLGVDAATIGTATSLVETGLRNLANPAVPASLNFPHDGLGFDHDSIGLFQQRSSGWGTVAQRMNPFASAGMFFNKLRSFNWRGMAPGDAAQRVQVSAFPGKYAGRMGQARGLVGAHGNFDRGGLLRGEGWFHKDTIRPERVLDPNTTRAFERLVDVLDTRRMPPPVSGVSVQQLAQALGKPVGGDGGQPLIGSLSVLTTPQASAEQIIGAAMHHTRVARHGGRYR